MGLARTRTICAAPYKSYKIAVGLDNACCALDDHWSQDRTIFTISPGGLSARKECEGATALALNLAGQLVVFNRRGMLIEKGGCHDDEAYSWKEVSGPTGLLAYGEEADFVEYACFDDEGAVVLGREIYDKDSYQDGSQYSSFGIRKIGNDGSLLEELYIDAEFDVCGGLTSLVFDPLTRRVLFTSGTSHAVRAIDNSSRTSIVVGSKSESCSEQSTCLTAEARFVAPRVVVDGDGNYIISDTLAHTVYLFRPAQGTVSILADSGEAGNEDGVGAAASFSRPRLLAIDRNGSVSQGTY